MRTFVRELLDALREEAILLGMAALAALVVGFFFLDEAVGSHVLRAFFRGGS